MADGSYASDWFVPTPLSSLAGDGYQSRQDPKRKLPRRPYRPLETPLCNEQQDLTPSSEHEVDRLA